MNYFLHPLICLLWILVPNFVIQFDVSSFSLFSIIHRHHLSHDLSFVDFQPMGRRMLVTQHPLWVRNLYHCMLPSSWCRTTLGWLPTIKWGGQGFTFSLGLRRGKGNIRVAVRGKWKWQKRKEKKGVKKRKSKTLSY